MRPREEDMEWRRARREEDGPGTKREGGGGKRMMAMQVMMKIYLTTYLTPQLTPKTYLTNYLIIYPQSLLTSNSHHTLVDPQNLLQNLLHTPVDPKTYFKTYFTPPFPDFKLSAHPALP